MPSERRELAGTWAQIPDVRAALAEAINDGARQRDRVAALEKRVLALERARKAPAKGRKGGRGDRAEATEERE